MSSIDFQNGFLCGMATRGLITNGLTYSRYVEVNIADGVRASGIAATVSKPISDLVGMSFLMNNAEMIENIDVTTLVSTIIGTFSDGFSSI